jgi:MFS family permease
MPSHRRVLVGAHASLWHAPDFLKLWLGQAVSQFGSLITGFALPLVAIVALHATPAQIALLSAARIAPALALGLVAGAWVDRVRRRPLLIAADLARALVVASVPVAAVVGQLSIALLFVVELLSAALSVCFDAAYPAYLPTLLRPEHLVEGNSKLAASDAVAEVAGFSAAGLLVQALTAPLAIAMDALTFLVSGLSLMLIRTREPMPERAPGAAGESGAAGAERRLSRFGSEVMAGLRLLPREPTARALAGATGLNTLGGNTLSVVLMIYLLDELRLPPAALGVVFGLGGVSAFAGALIAGRVSRRLGPGRAITWGMWITTVTVVLLPLAGGPAWLALGMLALSQLTDGGRTIWMVNQTAVFQAAVPNALQGRLHASLRVVEAAAMAGGLVLGGVLGQVIGPRATLVVAAGVMLLAPVWVSFSPVRHLRQMDAWKAEVVPAIGRSA